MASQNIFWLIYRCTCGLRRTLPGGKRRLCTSTAWKYCAASVLRPVASSEDIETMAYTVSPPLQSISSSRRRPNVVCRVLCRSWSFCQLRQMLYGCVAYLSQANHVWFALTESPHHARAKRKIEIEPSKVRRQRQNIRPSNRQRLPSTNAARIFRAKKILFNVHRRPSRITLRHHG